MRFLYHAGATRTVLAITAIATTMMGHAIRTGRTVLPGHIAWWGLFLLASLASLYATCRPTRTTIGFAAWTVCTVFVSRAVAVVLDALFNERDATTPSRLLAITSWLLLAYYAALVFQKISHRQEA